MLGNFVLRLLDADRNLIAWGKVQARLEPADSPGRSAQFRSLVGLTSCVVDQHGTVTTVVIEWTDAALVRLAPIGPFEVPPGHRQLDYTWLGPVWMIRDERDVNNPDHMHPLPPVIVREPVRIGVPPAQMGAKDPRS